MRTSDRLVAHATVLLLATHAARSAPTGETDSTSEHARRLPRLQDLRTGELNALLPRFRTSDEIGGSPFGTHTSSVFSEHIGDPKVLMPDIARAGFKWVKDYLPCGNMTKGQAAEDFLQRWEKPNQEGIAYLELAQASGLSVLLRLSNMRVEGAVPTTPEARHVFGRFCALQVRHYKQWVKDWELCNEPNIGNETPHFKPGDYAALCNEAYKAIKAADPEARVWVGATAMLQCLGDWPYPWIRETLEAGLTGDGFSIHPYCQPYVRQNFPERGSQFHPWNHWPDYAAQIADLRGKLATSQIGKGPDGRVPIASTESGWPTHVDANTWKQEISLLTQAKYEQRAMLLDFWLGIRPRINFTFTRPFQNIYERESQFQLVEPYGSVLMNWGNPENRDGLFRPAYYAAAAVCSNVDDSLRKTDQAVHVEADARLNPQVMTFERDHDDFGFTEMLILLWAGVPAEDDFQPKPATVTIPGDTTSLVCAPIGYSLLPIGARHSKQDEFDWKLTDLAHEVTEDSLKLLAVPLSDAPYVVKYARRK